MQTLEQTCNKCGAIRRIEINTEIRDHVELIRKSDEEIPCNACEDWFEKNTNDRAIETMYQSPNNRPKTLFSEGK